MLSWKCLKPIRLGLFCSILYRNFNWNGETAELLRYSHFVWYFFIERRNKKIKFLAANRYLFKSNSFPFQVAWGSEFCHQEPRQRREFHCKWNSLNFLKSFLPIREGSIEFYFVALCSFSLYRVGRVPRFRLTCAFSIWS